MAINPATTTLIRTIYKAPDLECHIRTVEVENVILWEMRDYIPSLDTYGRGYWLPLTDASMTALRESLDLIESME
jgi:hypothetical protein